MEDGVTGRPEKDEAAPYYFKYIDQVRGGAVLGVLESQLAETMAFLRGISEEKSLHRYEPAKWSIRGVLNHVNDTERLFVFRAFWFARGFEGPLPSFDQEISAGASRADDVSWSRHVEEFRSIRSSTIAFFKNLPRDAWMRTGVASENRFSVRALSWIAAGHLVHHMAILRNRYL